MTPEAAVSALVQVVPPPDRAPGLAGPDWDAFADRNGFAAPTDYRLMLERYGVGGFGTTALAGGWLYLLDPFGSGASFVELSDWERRTARGMQRQFPEQYPGWPIWPEPGGLLPWAGSADGDTIGWRTAAEPDDWGTRFFGRDAECEEFPFGAPEFILRLLTGSLGARDLDGRFHPLDAGEALRFFPAPAGPGEAYRAREHVTIVFAGLSPHVDATKPLSIAMRPAEQIIEAWREAAAAGFQVTGFGYHASRTTALHHEISGSFDSADASGVRQLVVELARRLGVEIAEVWNLEHDRIWVDLTKT